MSITFKICDKDKNKNVFANVKHDINGNIYFELENECYTVFTDKYDNVFLEKVRMANVESSNAPEYGKIKNLTTGYNLKAKLINQALDESNDDNELIDDEDEVTARQHYKLYPEDKFFDLENDKKLPENEDESSYFDSYDNELNKEHYVFYGLCDTSNNLMDLSTYDTLIFDGDLESNHLKFKSEIVNDNPLYRLSIYTLGYLQLNIIGSKIRSFSVEIVAGQLVCKLISHKLVYL